MSEFSYFAFVHGTIPRAADDPSRDGESLAQQCLAKLGELDTPEQFPPRLLILLVSSGYLDLGDGRPKTRASRLLRGIHQTFADSPAIPDSEMPPLIGSSVAAVFFNHPDFDNRVHEEGVLLICLASRLIEAKLAVGTNARQDPDGAIKTILNQLDLDPDGVVDPNPLADRMLFTFFPGYGEASATPAYPAADLQRMLRQGSRTRMRISGGVSSAGVPLRRVSGLQFADQEVLSDAVVTARITTGVPIGTSLAHGLTSTGQIVQVKKLSSDKKTIQEFEQGTPVDVLRQAGEHVLLGRLSSNCEPMILVPRSGEDGCSIQLWREIKDQDFFEVLKPEPEKILRAALDGVAQARNRILIQKPVGNLMLIGNQWRLRYNKVGLDIEHNLRMIEKEIPDAPLVGGFVDGQVGEDETGRSQFGNGSLMSMVFGDEMRERTPLHRGFTSIANYGARMTETSFLNEAIKEALEIVFEAGFPGAMLSLVLRDEKEQYLIAQRAIGTRYQKIVDDTRRKLHGDDILSKVALSRKSEFIRDSRNHENCDKAAVGKSGIISQYVIPLMRLDKRVVGILQVDLGKVSSLPGAEKEVLDSFGAIIGASINRLLNWSEASIARDLDPALNQAMTSDSIEEGLAHLVRTARDAFGVEMGHVRLADIDKRLLILVAGVGDCFERAKDIRRSASFDEITPICQSYRNGDVTIVNVAKNDFAYQQMRKEYSSHPDLLKALDKIGSYATVAFENEENEKLGALCLISPNEWYFTHSHERALEALGNRLGFLVEHFRRKESEKAARSRVHFVLNSGPRLAEIKNLDDLSGELSKAIERFCKEMKAEWGSLYMWDKDRNHYILRAQHGWKDPRWVNAACYSKDDRWTGASAVEGLPVYIPDFQQHYKEKGYPERYVIEAFGFTPSKDNVVEGIGLPLRVGKEDTGVLTLYRKKDGADSGFTILDHPHHVEQWKEIIQEGASDIAGLAFVLQSRQNERWEREEARRRRRISSSINQQNNRKSFEMRVCEEVLRSFRAVRADFYKVEEYGTEKKLLWVDGFRRDPKTNKITEEADLSPDRPTLPVEAFISNEIKVDRQRITDQERQDNPRLAATEGLVNRACILLVGDGKTIGVLDLLWRIGPNQASLLHVQHNENHLRALGTTIGSSYSKHQIKLDVERSHFATEAAAAYSFQQAHRLGNVVQRINSLSQLLKRAKNEDEREVVIAQLQIAVDTANKMTEFVIEHGDKVKNQSRKQHSLYNLLKHSLEDMDIDKKSYIMDGMIRVNNDVPKDIVVYVDFTLTQEAFINILNNAIQAIRNKSNVSNNTLMNVLSITAETTEDRRYATVHFRDTGTGMSEEQKNHALRGFFDTKGHKGVGVLISRVLLTAQGGDINYKTKEGEGTNAIVTLPLAYEGDKPKIVATLPKSPKGE